MPAPNHRGNIFVSTGFLNEKRNAENAVAQEMALRGFAGKNFDPDTENYDLAYGPADTTRRQINSPSDMGGVMESDEDIQNFQIMDRRHQGEN